MRGVIVRCCALLLAWCALAGPVHALSAADALAVARGDTDDRIAAINRLAGSGDARAADVLRALAAESLKFNETEVFIIDG